MNKKNIWKPLSLLSLFVAVATQAADPIQWDRVNTAMDVVAKAVVFGDDLVEYGRPTFDEKVTDLNAERVKYDLSGLVKNTPWHSGMKTEVNGTCTVSTDRTPHNMGIKVLSKQSAKTDVIAMFRQGSSTAWKSLTGPPKKFESRIKEHLFRGIQVTSLKDLYPLLLDAKQLGIEMSQFKVDDAKEWLACLKAGTCGGASTEPELKLQIAAAEKSVARYEAQKKAYAVTQIQALPSTENVEKIIVTNNEPVGFVRDERLGMNPTYVGATLTSNSVESQIDGFEPKTKEQLDKLHNRLQDVASKLQNGDSKTKEETFDGFRAALLIFKDVISGSWPK